MLNLFFFQFLFYVLRYTLISERFKWRYELWFKNNISYLALVIFAAFGKPVVPEVYIYKTLSEKFRGHGGNFFDLAKNNKERKFSALIFRGLFVGCLSLNV